LRRKHTLCLPTADLTDANKQYEYECPATGQTVRIDLGMTFGRVDRACPVGSVNIREA
jgi:hypothetical protein